MAAVSETIRFTIDKRCHKNALYLRWRNAKGATDNWLFTGEKDTELTVSDVSVTTNKEQRHTTAIRKPGYTHVIVRAGNLTENQADVISGIHTSPEVVRAYMLTSGKAQEKVYVVPGTFQVKTESDTRFKVEFRLEIRAVNSITN